VNFPGGITGSLGNILLTSYNGVQLADQFSGSDASCKISAAMAAGGTGGVVVDARNLSDAGGLGAFTIDPGVARSIGNSKSRVTCN